MESMLFVQMVNSQSQKRPTKRAPDAGDSAAISSSFLHLIIFLAGRLRQVHAPGQVTQTVKNFIISLLYIFTCVWISGCSNIPVATTNPTSHSEPQFAVSKKTSLEVYRNGKAYEILIGYSMGRAPFYATPVGETPKTWSENYADGAQIEAFSDFDNDGEMEILVSAFVCGANCSDRLMVYEYDSVNDTYFVSDEIWARLREYTDFNKDGTPEFTLYEYGFCFRCSNASNALSALAILQYKEGKFVDVSLEFPEQIQEHADRFLNSAINNEQDAAHIYLPGYLYDMYRLGKMEEGRVVFDEVCNNVLKPYSIDCASFRMEVEKSILEYKFRE